MVRAGARVCRAIAKRTGHRHLGNDLEINGKLADMSGPTGTKKAESQVCMGALGRAAVASSASQRFGTWAPDSDSPVFES